MFVDARALFVLNFLIGLLIVDSAADGDRLKILINSPTFAYAHSTFQATLAHKLAKEGHDVTILAVNVYTQLNYTVPTDNGRIKVINVDRPPGHNPATWSIQLLNQPFNGHQNMFIDGNFAVFGKTVTEFCDELTGNRELMEQLKQGGYHVGISEEIDMCGFAIFHYAGIRTKIVSNTVALYLSIANIYGIPLPPSYVPNLAAASDDAPYMSFVNRARTLFYNTIETELVARSAIQSQQKILDKNFGPKFPRLSEIMKNASLILVNQFDYLDLPHPISAKVISIGGICFQKPKALNEKFAHIFRSAHSGVVFVSFGTVANLNRAPDLQLAMIRTFSKFPNHSFIWKMRPANAAVEKALRSAVNVFAFGDWLDQTSILNQIELKAFITHCGVNGYQEAAWAGVPMIGIPLFADQLYNCAAMKYRGLGVVVDIRDMMKSGDFSLHDAIAKVLGSSGYRKNARQMSRKLRAQPFSADEKLSKYVIFAARFEHFNELNLPNYDEVGLFQYYSADVLLAAIGFVTVLAVVAVIIPIHCFLSVICFRSNKY